jgi:hypothetical protein
VIPFRIGDVLVAVEDGPFLPWTDPPRWPHRLIVQARIIWVASSSLTVRLPQTKVVVAANCVVLPTMVLRLSRQIEQTPWASHRGKPGEPCEWKYQPFYPKVRGKACTAKFATFYTWEVWSEYRHFFDTPAHTKVNPVVANSAALLGVDSGAKKEEVTAAFRETVRKVHPDVGGDTEAFQRLVEARNVLLANCPRQSGASSSELR